MNREEALESLKSLSNYIRTQETGMGYIPKEVEIALTMLKIDEGYRNEAYLCSENYVTIGYGTKVCDIKGFDPKHISFTVTPEIATQLLKTEVDKVISQLKMKLRSGHSYDIAPPTVRAVLIGMGYQLGIDGLMKFKKTWEYLNYGQYKLAADEMLDSKWAKQTPNRAAKYSEIVRRA